MTKKKVSAATTLDERLEALRGQPKEELAALLAELAAAHTEVEERLTRHALAADPRRARYGSEPIGLEELLEARDELIREVHRRLGENEKRFPLSVKRLESE